MGNSIILDLLMYKFHGLSNLQCLIKPAMFNAMAVAIATSLLIVEYSHT